MKKNLISFILILLAVSALAQNRKINFSEKSWKENLALSKEQHKLIFLDAYASWCGPCKWMAKNMFTNDTIADYYNDKFICISMDMEKGEGLELARQYRIRAYPTLLFIDESGQILHRKVGAPQRVKEYIDLGNIAQDPARRFATLEKRYQSGDNSPEFIYSYLNLVAESYMPVNDILQRYFASQTEKNLTNRPNWNIINRFVTDPDSPQFTYLMAHQKDFSALYSGDSVQGKVSEVYENDLYNTMRNLKDNDSIYNQVKEKLRSRKFSGADKIIFNSDLTYYQRWGKNAKFLNLVYNDLDRFYGTDPDMLNNVAWSVASMSGEDKYLQKALFWSRKSNELKKDPNYIDTYAGLLHKTGNKEEAIRQEKAAIDLARQMGKPTMQYEEQLKVMEK